MSEFSFSGRGWVPSSPEESENLTNLIVNYIPHNIDDSELQSIFIDFGPIISAKVVKDKGTKESSLGYGFVKFRTEESARLAIEKRNGFHMGSKTLKVSYARPACDEIRNCKLYVTNLPREYNEKEVMALFSQFGLIIECRVLKNKEDNYGKGVAFVQYNLRSEAAAALALNRYCVPGSDRTLLVKYSDDRRKGRGKGNYNTYGGHVVPNLYHHSHSNTESNNAMMVPNHQMMHYGNEVVDSKYVSNISNDMYASNQHQQYSVSPQEQHQQSYYYDMQQQQQIQGRGRGKQKNNNMHNHNSHNSGRVQQVGPQDYSVQNAMLSNPAYVSHESAGSNMPQQTQWYNYPGMGGIIVPLTLRDESIMTPMDSNKNALNLTHSSSPTGSAVYIQSPPTSPSAKSSATDYQGKEERKVDKTEQQSSEADDTVS